MKILLTNEHCNIGGVETFMIALCSELQMFGHQCELFFFQHGSMEEHIPRDCVAHFGDTADLIKLVSSENFDIVHAHSTDWERGISGVRNIGAKLIVTVQHDWIVRAWTSANCDAITACSKWLTEEQQAFSDIPVQTVLYGINITKFKPNKDLPKTQPPIVAWVGRGVGWQKRIDKLAEVAPALHQAGLRLWLAEPNGAEEVEKIIPGIKHSLLPIVEFWDAVPREKMPEFFQKIAASGGCVLCTSETEGLGLAWVEAQACGCPVIGPDVRGINECVSPDHGGVLYSFETDAEQLESLILKTIYNKEEHLQRGILCAEYAREQFNVQRMTQEYLNIYRQVLKVGDRSSKRKMWFQGAPSISFREYLGYRWTEGYILYQTSQKLANQGFGKLAAAMARASLKACPFLYTRLQRLSHLIKTNYAQAFKR